MFESAVKSLCGLRSSFLEPLCKYAEEERQDAL